MYIYIYICIYIYVYVYRYMYIEIAKHLQIINISASIEFAINGGLSSMSSCTKTPSDQISL